MSEFPRPAMPDWPILRVRLLTQRWPRFLGSAALCALAAIPLVTARADAQDVADSWQTEVAWVTRQPVAAGNAIPESAVIQRDVPVELIPEDAATTNPAGQRTRAPLVPNEIVRIGRLTSIVDGSGGIELQVPAGHLQVGSLVDLYDLLTGRRVAKAASVVGVDSQQRPTIAVAEPDIGAVIRSLANGEVVPVLVG